MTTLIHGEDVTAARNYLTELRRTHKGEIQILTLDNAAPETLSQMFGTSSLFGENRLVILEGFFTSRKQAPKVLPPVGNVNLIVWEGKKLTPAQVASIQKLIPAITVHEFKQNKVVFLFVEALRPGNQRQTLTLFREYLKVEIVEIVFSMIIRQFRLLLLVQSGTKNEPDEMARISTWQRPKLETQAKLFADGALTRIYAELLAIDFRNKSGQSPIDLTTALELFLLKL